VGEEMRELFERLPAGQQLGYFPAPGIDLLTKAITAFAPEDRVLVKGSNRIFWGTNFVALLVDALSSSR
jgi:hypothetical protein